MTEYIATSLGLYPLPDWAKQTLSDLKGHQKHDLISGDESDAIIGEYDSARTAVIEIQEDAGLNRIVEGQLRWDDMLTHPLAVNDAVDTQGIVRYYDNNNFYRESVVEEALQPSGDIGEELTAAEHLTDEPLQAVLPGPYSLADLATNHHYDGVESFIEALGVFLAGEIQRFPDVETLFLLEPSLVTEPPGDGQRSAAIEAINAISAAFPGQVVVYGYWAAYDDETHAALLETEIDALGYDLVSAPENSAELVREQGTTNSIALGVIDGQNTLVESPAGVREQVSWFESQLESGFEHVYVTPNTELFYLPVSKFEEKLAVLGEAVRPEVTA